MHLETPAGIYIGGGNDCIARCGYFHCVHHLVDIVRQTTIRNVQIENIRDGCDESTCRRDTGRATGHIEDEFIDVFIPVRYGNRGGTELFVE